MIRLTVAWLCAGLASLFILWRESGENTAVFCYRMSSGLYLLAANVPLRGSSLRARIHTPPAAHTL